jgi:GH43 family beta-xylosidase
LLGKYKKYILFMIILVMSFILASCSTSQGGETIMPENIKTFKNPILPEESADPWMVYAGGTYFYIYSTEDSIAIRKSNTLGGLEKSESRIVWKAPESGEYSKNVWAPELHYLNSAWYIYFCADDGNNANHRMYVLEGGTDKDNPLAAPFTFKGKVGDSSNKWAIDGTVLQKKDGSLYMIWSGWEGSKDGRQNLYIAPMSNPWTIRGERVLISEPTELWERMAMPINEGPTVIMHEDKTFIVYSASGSWTGDYCLGLLENTDGDVLNPASWKKSSSPVFQKSEENKVYGVGHCSFIKSPNGKEDWIIYHGMNKANAGWKGRSARAQKFSWKEDDTPDFGVPVSTDRELEEPSGQK